jgi:formylglycine-generating enzyme required for sulfatase activity
MIENALKERRAVRAEAMDLQALKAQGVEMPEALPGAESIRMKAEEYFDQGAWQKSEELFKSILPIYSGAVEEGKKYLGIQVATQEAAKMQSFGFEMVAVKGGCYQMGDLFSRHDPDNDEHPIHEVCVDDFEIGKFEVTQGLWQWVMGSNPSKFKKGDNYPVEQVSWKDVQMFLDVLNQKTGQNFRLPTEAEWEYAARSGGKKENFSGGDNVETVAWHGTNSAGSTHPVGRKAPNGLGLHDMSGNVYEWCSDWYEHDYYSKSPRNNPKGPDNEVMELLRSSTRVFRGGSWDSSIYYVRNTYRSNRSSDFRYNLLGFRLLKTD